MIEKQYKKYVLLERYLNRLKYLNVPMGGTLADQFILNRVHGLQPELITLKHLFLAFFRLFLSLFKKNSVVFKTPVLATWLTARHHFSNMMTPIIKHYKKDITVIYNPEVNKEDLFGACFFSIKQTFNTPLNMFFPLMAFYFKTFFVLSSKRKQLSLNTREILFYSLRLFHQAKIIAFYTEQFKKPKNMPHLVITEFDRNGVAAPLILTARIFGIKTVTLVHGVIGNYGYTPVLADYIYCFGEIQKTQLLAQGVAPEKIRVTGTSIIDLAGERAVIKTRDPSVFRLGLGISPLRKETREKMIRVVAQAAEKVKKTELVIKLHPSLKKEDFTHFLKTFKNTGIKSSAEIDNNTFFKNIDLLIINSSGLGIEAMYQEVPVILMKLQENECGHFDLTANESGLPVFSKESELIGMLLKYTADNNALQSIGEKGNAFARSYYFATGKEASQNIIKELTTLLNS